MRIALLFSARARAYNRRPAAGVIAPHAQYGNKYMFLNTFI
jgi:hypothetical protein